MDREKMLTCREELTALLSLELTPRLTTPTGPRVRGQIPNGVTAETQKSIAEDFRIWLDSWQFTPQSFMTFLNSWRNTMDSKTDKDLIEFVKEFNSLFGEQHISFKGTKGKEIKTWKVKEVSYKGIVNWNNYTIYKKRFLLIACYTFWFQDLGERVPAVCVVNNREAIGYWSFWKKNFPKAFDQKQRDFKGWKESNKFPLQVKMNFVRNFQHLNASSLKRGYVKTFDTLKSSQKHVGDESKEGDSHIGSRSELTIGQKLYQYSGPLRSFSFKYANNQISSFVQRRKTLAKFDSRGKRLKSLNQKNSVDWIPIKKFLAKHWGWNPFDNVDASSKTFNKLMTVVFHKLRLKRYTSMTTFPTMEPNKVDVNLCRKFMTEVDQSFQRWDLSKQ